MSGPKTPLSSVLADIARAVVSTQKDLDREADKAPVDSSLPPLAFVVKQTQLDLLGQLSVQAGAASIAQDRALTFSQVSRVQAALYGTHGTALTSRISVLIQATEPKHAG